MKMTTVIHRYSLFIKPWPPVTEETGAMGREIESRVTSFVREVNISNRKKI
jgi:hypothetical protein